MTGQSPGTAAPAGQIHLRWKTLRPHRRGLLAASVVLVIGSAATTAAYTFHLYGSRYRRQAEAKIEAFFDLPASIGRVVPLSFHSRGFRGLTLWLPNRDEVVYHGQQAVWHDEPTPEYPQAWRLELYDGRLIIDEALSRRDVAQRVRAGLGGIEALQLRAVDVFGVDLTYRRHGVELTAQSATGQITFPAAHRGKAAFRAHVLNDTEVDEPIQIYADFDPRGGVILHQLILECARVPIRALALEGVLGGPVTHGRFSGKVLYQERLDHWLVTLTGTVDDVALGELTALLPGGPIGGTVALRLHEARFVEQRLDRLQVTGQVHGVPLAGLARVLRLPPLSGTADLRLQECLLEDGRIVHLSVTGHVRDVPCEQLSELLGEGEITGWLDVRINRVYIEDNELRSADIDVVARPPTDRPGTIERSVFLGAVQRIFGVKLPPLLPAHIEYAQLGAKLLVEQDRLRILGSHGEDGRTIMTVRVRGLEFPIIRQPNASFDLAPALDYLSRQTEQYDLTEVLQPPVTGNRPTDEAD